MIYPATYRIYNIKTTLPLYKAKQQIIPNRYPLLRIEDIIDYLNKNRYFRLFDKSKAYRQLKIVTECRKFTTLITRGFYKWVRVLFGLMQQHVSIPLKYYLNEIRNDLIVTYFVVTTFVTKARYYIDLRKMASESRQMPAF